MGTGQMLLTIGAMMLLGTIILTTNRGIEDSTQVLLNTGYGIDAVSLATSTIERANGLAFDQNTKDDSTGKLISLSQLTPPASLGQENGDSTDFDDFDDFNGLPGGPNSFYNQLDTLRLPTDTTKIIGIYDIKTEVHYVYRDPSSGDFVEETSSADTATWSKELDVWVWSVTTPDDSVHMRDIFSYWY
jgi:hypothetical protein